VPGHHEALLGNAEWLIEQHQYAAAILLSHSAMEMYVLSAYTTLYVRAFGPLEDGWEDAVVDRSLMSRAGRATWSLMSAGHRLEGEVYKRYRKAVEQRNRVAHNAMWPGIEAARESVEAVREMIGWLELSVAPIRASLKA
jgi:hypothetical protein